MLCAEHQVSDAEQAVRLAERLRLKHCGVMAFARAGNPDTGDWDDTSILAMYGQIPTEIMEQAHLNKSDNENTLSL